MTAVSNHSSPSGYSREVNAIYSDCLRCLCLQKKWSDDAGKIGNPTVTGKRYSPADVNALRVSIEAHCRSLVRVKDAGDQLRQRTLAEELVLPSFHSHVCALLRAHTRRLQYISAEQLLQTASQSKQWLPLSEAIVAKWLWKSKGGLRLIRREGPRRTARQQVCKSINGGYRWWWTPDIKSYFASLRPSHLKWLPLTRLLVKNDVFTPRCAKER